MRLDSAQTYHLVYVWVAVVYVVYIISLNIRAKKGSVDSGDERSE
jgi:hypothetical protein